MVNSAGINDTAHLVVGLGGVGVKALSLIGRFLARLFAQMPPNWVRCLALDCDTSSLNHSALDQNYFAKYLLSTERFAEVRSYPKSFPSLAAWLPDNLPAPKNGQGTLGSSALGRLALAVQYREIQQTLAQQLAYMGFADSHNNSGQARPTRVAAWFITSLGGGTGAGLLCPLAYAWQQLTTKLNVSASSQSIIFLGQGLNGDETAACNCYAALTELNHWMSPDTTYEVTGSAAAEAWKTSQPPFNQVYLLPTKDLRNSEELSLSCASAATLLGTYMGPNSEVVEAIDKLNAPGQAKSGNPRAYCTFSTAALYMPGQSLSQAVHTYLASTTVKQWIQELFNKDMAKSSSEGRKAAETFLSGYDVQAKSILAELHSRINQAERGQYNVEAICANCADTLTKHKAMGNPLLKSLQQLDKHLRDLLGSEANSGLCTFLHDQAQQILDTITTGLMRQSLVFVNTERKNCLGFKAFLDELSRQTDFYLSELHSYINDAETSLFHLEDEKVLKATQAFEYHPQALKRLLGTATNPYLQDAVSSICSYYRNRLAVYVGRETLAVYIGFCDIIAKFSSSIVELKQYLEAADAELTNKNKACLQSLFNMPGEALISREEAQQYVEHYALSGDNESITGSLAEMVGADLLMLPSSRPCTQWVSEILQAVAKLHPLPQASATQRFFELYPEDTGSERLSILDEQASLPAIFKPLPASEPNPVNIVHWAVVEPDLEGHNDNARLSQLLASTFQGKAPLDTLLTSQQWGRICLVYAAASFTLADLDLPAAHKAYVQSLRLGMRSVHSCRDCHFLPLAPPTVQQRNQIRQTLALAVHFGLISEKGQAASATIDELISSLSSPRWPDLASLKACLHIYPDPLEAFHVESVFLSALNKWLQERIDENGVEGYLKSLQTSATSLPLLGLDLLDSLRQAAASFASELEASWPEWSSHIAKSIEQEPTLQANDLLAVPQGARRWAMLRYIREHANDNLSFHASSGVLELVSARDIEHLDRAWLSLTQSCEKGPEAFAQASAYLVQFICNSLGFNVCNSLSLGNLSGSLVAVHGLRIKIPSQIPMLVCRQNQLASEDVEAWRSILEQGGPESRFGIALTLGQPEPIIATVKKQLGNLLRYDVIVLNYNDLRDILRVRFRLKELVKIILRQVDLTVVSPFVTEGPVPATMFFGREGEIKEAVHRLENTSVCLIGPRRIGKTSILQRVLAALRTKPRPVVYLDCQSIFSATSFLQALALEYAPSRANDDVSSPRAFKALVETISAAYAGAPVEFILDEVDLVLREDPQGSENLFRTFKVANLERSAHFLFCGERVLLEKLKDPNSALYNFCPSIRVRCLEPDDARHLISEPLGQMEITFENDKEGIERLLEITSGHPNLVQRTCASLVERLNSQGERIITGNHITSVTSDPNYVEEYLDTVWGRANELEKIICLLFDENSAYSANEVRHKLAEYKIEPKAKDMLESLDNLCLFGILERQGPKYALLTKYLPRLVSEVMDVQEEIELHKEMIDYGN